MNQTDYKTSLRVENVTPTNAESTSLILPEMVPVLQRFPKDCVADIESETRSQLDQFSEMDLRGKRIAITAGSRGIKGLVEVLRATVDQLRTWGAEPFIVPAMGSHGGATAPGQIDVLASLEITEASVGAPIHSSMEVVEIGRIEGDTKVYCDRLAFESDGIIVCNRVKAHTAFAADFESGLLKMMLIGLGKHVGTTAAHKLGFNRFHHIVPHAAAIMLDKAPILFGIALIENAYSQLAKIEGIPTGRFFERERENLKYAKTLMGRILVPEIDVLIIDAIGKDISGGGMDSNVTGRSATGVKRDYTPTIKQIVIRDLTPSTKGNAIGIGLADVTTVRAVEKMNLAITYTNALTSRTPTVTKIPLIAESDRQAIEIACRSAVAQSNQMARIVQIANTKDIDRIWLSTSYLPEIESRDDLVIDGKPQAFKFDPEGNQIAPAFQ